MADTLVKTKASEHDDLHVYATRDTDSVYVMIMNESRSEEHTVSLEIKGFKPARTGNEITLSSREYFWNPYAGRADWNSGPSVIERKMSTEMEVKIPPYGVRIFQYNAPGTKGNLPRSEEPGEAELRVLLPESGFSDLPMEGWVRAFKKGTDLPYTGELGSLDYSVKGSAGVEVLEPGLAGAVARFILKPEGAGPVTLQVECDGLRTAKTVNFKPVNLEKQVAWDFDEGLIAEPYNTLFEHAFGEAEGRDGQVLQLEMPGVAVERPDNRILEIKKYPREIPRSRIGGVCFDVFVPKGFKPAPETLKLQIVLQSENAFWIPCGELTLEEADGKWASYQLEIPDKKLLRAMDKGFSVLFDLVDGSDPDGTICIDNLGFLLRPE
jgi:hypothetical protein